MDFASVRRGICTPACSRCFWYPAALRLWCFFIWSTRIIQHLLIPGRRVAVASGYVVRGMSIKAPLKLTMPPGSQMNISVSNSTTRRLCESLPLFALAVGSSGSGVGDLLEQLVR